MELKDYLRYGHIDFETSWLLHNGIIDHVGTIYENDARGVGSALDLIGNLIDEEKITLDILRFRIWSCPGGGAAASLAAFDALRSWREKYAVNIQTEVYGSASSAGAMVLLQAGDIRLAGKHSVFLMHEISQYSDESESYSDITDKKTGMDMTTKIVYTILAERCGKTYTEVFDFIDRRENWMTYQNALDWGLIDGPIS